MPHAIPYRDIPLGNRQVDIDRRKDGSVLVRNTESLGHYGAKLTDQLADVARAHPQRVFIAERDRHAERPQWQTLTYEAAWQRVRAVGQALLQRRLSVERPVAILSGGSIEHAVLGLAAMHVGIPWCSVTPAYSLLADDDTKLKRVLEQLGPGLVFVDDGRAFAPALAGALPAGVEVVHGHHPVPGGDSTAFAELERTPVQADFDSRAAEVSPDSVARILFTSGSTGQPKGVIHTQRMLACNQVMMLQALPVIAQDPLVILSWLPWHHVSGGNQMLGLTLQSAGSLYLDDGRPVPGEIERTVRNLRDISPTVYFSVPRGFAMLLPYLKADAELREHFFSRLRLLYYSGASLGASLVRELDALAVQTIGCRIPMMSGYGATESAPASLAANWLTPDTGLAGLPIPGCELKLVPVGADKFEARVRGPHVTPGYWRRPEATAALFDDEGFACLGDALSWVDPQDPAQGLAFEGRLSEDFKLATGTWVGVGALRARLMQASDGLLLDAIVVGEGRDEVGALLVVDPAAEEALAVASGEAGEHPLHDRLQAALDALAGRATGSSTYVARAMVLREPPSSRAGELTEKGSINVRALLANRPQLLNDLYAEPAGSKVLRPASAASPGASPLR